jgi:hypothetical protein
MSFSFRPAVRENVGLLIGLAGGTGSGKTYSAMELAAGISGDRPFAVVDTEAKRALHYADRFRFDHGELRAPFRPAAYAEAIAAADAAGYPVIVVDSTSHEHAGEGGLLDWHDTIVAEAVEKKRQLCESKGWQFDEDKEWNLANMNAWIEPKMAHKQFVQKLLQLRAHLILCFRAEEKIEIVKLNDRGEVVDKGGKTVVRPKETATGRDGWVPVCEKTLPYELTASFLMLATRPGYPLPIKLQEQHRALFPLDKPIGRSAGEAIARWAAGGNGAPARATAEPSKALALVIEVMNRATTLEELAATAAPAGELSALEKAMAKEHYRERHAALTAAKAKSEGPQ